MLRASLPSTVEMRRQASPELAEGGALVLTVSDTGPGMEPEGMEHIFEPCFTTKGQQGEGTGLGLAVVHGIVNTHRGAAQVQSKPGRGSLFRVFLPQGQGEDALPPPPGTSLRGRGERTLWWTTSPWW